MKIRSIEVSKENMALSRPYQIAYKMVESVECLILKLHLENGMVGWGASNISAYVVGQNNEDTYAAYQNGALDFLAHQDIRQFGKLMQETEVQLSKFVGLRVMCDIALYDAFTQYLQIPLVDYWGAKHKSMATSVTIGIMGLDQTLEEAREFIGAGFRILKVKLGAGIKEDVERLVALRKTFGQKIMIRVDANQGWSLSETIQFFETTKELNIELVEQPVKANEIFSLLEIPEHFRDKIAADESLKDSSDARDLSVHNRPAGIFNIKLMKCGGITEALKIAKYAQSSSIDLMWGCNDESIISITAALHAAFACPNTRFIDLDGSFDLAKDVVTGGFELKNGVMSLTQSAGLGVKPLLI